MNLPRTMFEEFDEFVKIAFGCEIDWYPTCRSGEFGRFMMGESLFVIRSLSENCGGELIEVFSSNAKLSQMLENQWGGYVADLLKDQNDGNDLPGDGPELQQSTGAS